MKLAEIIEITDENIDVEVLDLDWNVMARYDGRNSIPINLNELEVVEISNDADVLQVVVDEDSDPYLRR